MLFNLDQNTYLQRDLRSFGLNPNDWKVLKEKSQIYRVESKTDRNFIFKGSVKHKGSSLKWDKLELAGI